MRDLRIAFRALANQPGFTTVAVVTIALGVGANSAIFSVVDAVMLRPMPFTDPAAVVVVTERTPQLPTLSVSPLNYADVCAGVASFEACGAARNTTFNLSGTTEPQRVAAKMMSAGVLPLLGVQPILGRGFTPAEDSPAGEPVAILSHGLWQNHFGGAPTAVGERVLLDGVPYAVVGVLPPSFSLFQAAEVSVPIGAFLAAQPDDRGWHPGILPIARLKAGASIEQARTEAQALALRLERAYPQTNTRVSFNVTRAQDLLVQGVRTALLMLLGAVAGVLLIACLNVAGLLLARGLSRRRDVAVRIALGAGHARIVRHLLAESLLIALAGGAAGLLLASFAVPVLVDLVGPTVPRADAVSVDQRVVIFTFGLALLAVATTTHLPMAGGGATIHFNVRGSPPSGPEQFTTESLASNGIRL